MVVCQGVSPKIELRGSSGVPLIAGTMSGKTLISSHRRQKRTSEACFIDVQAVVLGD